MNSTRAGAVLSAAIVAIVGSCAVPAPAQEALAPTPRVVIYPGDVIRDDMLADVAEPARDGSGPYVEQLSLIVGKVARLTLHPGHAIPFSGVSNRKLVANGAGGQAHLFRGRPLHHDDRRGVTGRLDRRHRQGPQQ